jgi:hypothetical protein
MEIVAETLVLLVVLQTALRLSQWPNQWLRLAFCLAVGGFVLLATDRAAGLSKLQMESWLHDTTVLQDVAVVCLLDALLCRLRWYPGLLILPAAFYVLCQLLFTLTGSDFHTIGLLTAVALSATLLLLAKSFTWLLPRRADRSILHVVITILLCLVCLILTIPPTPLTSYFLPLFMEHISNLLFGIANILLIPDILLLIIFFVRSLVLLATTAMQYSARQRDGHSSLYTKYRNLLYDREPDEAYADYLATQFEAEAAKDVNLSRLLTKLGPVLGLIGTLISMSPALVGLSTGDISGMAYNMQVVFSATVVGLVISVVGLFTQQLKSRWYAKDLGRLDYVSRNYIERHEKEA